MKPTTSRRRVIVRGTTSAMCLSLVCILVAGPAVSAETDTEEFMRCALIDKQAERLACYDRVAAAKRSDGAEGRGDARREVPGSNSGTNTARREGLESGSRVDEQGDEETTSQVVSCEQGHDGRYFFVLSNGQVWKQVNADREHFRSCQWKVLISRDFFGYRMQREGEQRRIRVKRVK